MYFLIEDNRIIAKNGNLKKLIEANKLQDFNPHLGIDDCEDELSMSGHIYLKGESGQVLGISEINKHN